MKLQLVTPLSPTHSTSLAKAGEIFIPGTVDSMPPRSLVLITPISSLATVPKPKTTSLSSIAQRRAGAVNATDLDSVCGEQAGIVLEERQAATSGAVSVEVRSAGHRLKWDHFDR